MSSFKDLALDISEKEEWKDIPGFEGLYQASTLGKIRSLDKYVNYKNKGLALKKGIILNPKISNKGYYEVTLMKNLKRYYKRVHKLIALTFIENPNNYTIINHINENKLDNRIENLEWCTCKYNIEVYHENRMNIYQYDLNGNFIKEWKSITKAANEFKLDKTGIQHCCKGCLKTYKNYIWSYKKLNKDEINKRLKNNVLVKINQCDNNGNILNTFNSITEAAKFVGCNPSAISMYLSGVRKNVKGYIWKRV